MNCGINWDCWDKVKVIDVQTHYYDAMFYWADKIMEAIQHIRSQANIFINGAFLDSFHVLSFIESSTIEVLDELERCSRGEFPKSVEAFL